MNIIKQISWERTNLILKFEKLNQNEKFYLFNEEDGETVIELNPYDNSIKILLTNTPEGEILSKGKWKIVCGSKKTVLEDKLIERIDDFSRVFKYKSDTYAYIVTISVDEDKQLYINTQFMMKNEKPHKSRPGLEGINKTKKIKNLIQKISLIFANVIYSIAHQIVLNKNNKIVFLNENGNELTGNALAFYEYLKKNKEYNIKVYCKNVFTEKTNYFQRLKQMMVLASCNYIIVDNYTPILTFLNIPKDVRIIQLWHAGVGFKSVGYARFGLEGSPHPYVSGHRKYDYVVVDDESLIDVYQEVFGVSKSKFIPVGMPRLENYLDEDKITKTVNKFYEENKEFKEKKIILFAPTFRGVGQIDAYYDMELIDQEALVEFCKKYNYIIIFKFHPYTNNKLEIKEQYKDILLDYTSKEYNINDLMYITDILITDYSSCAYEYSLFERPLVFYRYDKIIYEYTRGIHTKDVFTEDTYEVLTFKELLEVLNKLSSKPKFNIKEAKKKERNSSICSLIEKEIFGRK